MTSLRSFGLFLLLFTLVFQQPKESSAEKPSEQVEAVSGWTASLPCRVRNVDTPLLVLWYRQGQAHPFYSFDARGGNLSAGEGGVHDFDFGPRSSFELSGRLHLPSYSLDLGRKSGLSRTRAHTAWERQPERKRRRRKRRWDEKVDWPEEEAPKQEAKDDAAPVVEDPKGPMQKREYYQEPRASNEVNTAGDAEAKKDSKEEGREQGGKGETKKIERAKVKEGGTEGEGEQQEGQRLREEDEEDIVVDFKSLPIFPGTLYIRNVGLKDAGGFHCRVDFLNSPTRNHRLNLTVYEPPQRISVVDGHGQNLQAQGTAGTGLVIGPLDEGASLLVVCNVFGGSPPPSIQWLKNGKVIRDDVSGSGGDGKWSNTLFVHHLKPEDQESTFSCKVSNNNLLQPNITNVTLDMNIKPSSVRISGISGPLDAGSRAEVMCTASGSRPRATITWILDNDSKWKPIRNTQSHTMKGDTVSSVVWKVRPGDDQARLTCIATNPRNPHYQRSNHTTLTVYHAPETNLFLGRGLDPKTIKEGVDVYFDCHVKANPPPTSTVFFHQGVEVTKKSFPGAILSGFSLALQKVTPSMAGEYSCRATNAKGSSTSEVVNLEVMYKPVCRTPKQTASVSLDPNVTVECAVDAFPPPSRFAWSLNDTKGLVPLPPTQFESRGETSRLHYTMPEKDAQKKVELLCWATNSLGNQQAPCVIKVFAPGKPKQVQGCTMEQRKKSLVVSCRPGVEGAVDQTYQAQLRLSDSDAVVANVTSRVPSFSFDVLEKGLEYEVYVYTLNPRYRSSPVILEVSSLKVAENRMNSGSPDGSKGASLLALFIGVIAAFLLTLAVILAATKLRCSAVAAAGATKAGRSGGARGEAGGSIVGLEDNCDSDDDDNEGRVETSVGKDPKDGQTHQVQVEAQSGSHSKESVGASSQDHLLQSTASSLGIQQNDPLLSRDALSQASDATVYKNVSFDEGHTKGYSVLGSRDHALGSPFASSSSSQFGVAYSGETVGLLSPSSARSHVTENRGPTPLLYGTLGQPRPLLPQHPTHSLGRQSRLLQETGTMPDFVGTNNRRLQSSASFITPHPDVSSTVFMPAGVRVPGCAGPSTMEVTVRGLTSLSPVGGSTVGGGGGGGGGEIGLAETGASGTAPSPSTSSQYRGWSEGGGVSMTDVQLPTAQGASSRCHTLSLASAAATTTTTTTISARRTSESFV